MAVDFDIAGFEQELRLHAAKKLARVAVHIVAAHQRNLSVANPAPHKTPAPRGQYPRGRTFFLRANVGFQPTSLPDLARTLAVSVGVYEPAIYGLYLRNKGWKGLLDTIRAESARIDALLNGRTI
jgi:hypothetical protein